MTSTSTARPLEWAPLSRADLTTFDDVMTNIVMEYGELGWVGKMSKKGHAILRAPDGIASVSVSRSSNRGRSGVQARADLERWKNSQPGRSFGITSENANADANQYLAAIAEKTMHDKRAVKYLERLRDEATNPDDLENRVALITQTGIPGRWALLDTHLRSVFAWSKDMNEDEAHIFAYETFTIETPPVFVCEHPECIRTFANARALAGHLNAHKPWSDCEVEGCGWRGAYLDSHMRRKHRDFSDEQAAWDSLSPESQAEVEDLLDGPHNWTEPVSTVVDDLVYTDPLDAVQALVKEVQDLRGWSASITAMSEENAKLTEEVAAITKERDDLQARLELLRETLSL